MCGITGILNLQSSKHIQPAHLEQLITPILYRGPDESGAYLDDSIGLAHARLSIIGLDDGIQPLHNEDKSFWLIFNGEIYNYLELKSELVEKGHIFSTSTDSEVILHHYEEKGIDFLKDLNGQFAFAIWDTKKEELLLARDRLGIRPLHYTIAEGQFIFSSEIKSIFTQNSVKRELNNSALNQIFTYWTTIPGYTAFTEINELPAAHYLIISKEKQTLNKYWELPYYNKDEKVDWTLDRITEEINDLLFDSIKLRLRADVTVGAYLSGGLDSSVIASCVKANFNQKLKTFGIRFEDDKFDEGHYQKQIVSQLETEHSEIIASNEEIGKSFSDVIWHTEKPILRTAPVPLYMLSNLVKQKGIKVVLTGEGADEFFGGYNIFREAKARWFWARNKDSQIRYKLLSSLYPYLLNDKRIKNTISSYFGRNLDQVNSHYFSHQLRWDNTKRISNFLNNELFENENGVNLDSILDSSFNERDYLERAQYLEIKTFMSNYLLSSQGDRVAMANSIEIRFPFLDHRLIEFLAKVPSRLKIYGMNEKFLLKRAYRSKLPESIIKRPKHPYRAPILNSLLSKSNTQNCDKYCSKEAIKEANIFNHKPTNMLFEKIKNKKVTNETESMAISGIYSTQVVYDKFIKNYKVSTKSDFNFDLFVDNRKK